MIDQTRRLEPATLPSHVQAALGRARGHGEADGGLLQ